MTPDKPSMLVSCLLSTAAAAAGVCVSPVALVVSEETIFSNLKEIQDAAEKGRAADYSMTPPRSPSRHGTFGFKNRPDYRPARPDVLFL